MPRESTYYTHFDFTHAKPGTMKIGSDGQVLYNFLVDDLPRQQTCIQKIRKRKHGTTIASAFKEAYPEQLSNLKDTAFTNFMTRFGRKGKLPAEESSTGCDDEFDGDFGAASMTGTAEGGLNTLDDFLSPDNYVYEYKALNTSNESFGVGAGLGHGLQNANAGQVTYQGQGYPESMSDLAAVNTWDAAAFGIGGGLGYELGFQSPIADPYNQYGDGYPLQSQPLQSQNHTAVNTSDGTFGGGNDLETVFQHTNAPQYFQQQGQGGQGYYQYSQYGRGGRLPSGFGNDNTWTQTGNPAGGRSPAYVLSPNQGAGQNSGQAQGYNRNQQWTDNQQY